MQNLTFIYLFNKHPESIGKEEKKRCCEISMRNGRGNDAPMRELGWGAEAFCSPSRSPFPLLGSSCSTNALCARSPGHFLPLWSWSSTWGSSTSSFAASSAWSTWRQAVGGGCRWRAWGGGSHLGRSVFTENVKDVPSCVPDLYIWAQMVFTQGSCSAQNPWGSWWHISPWAPLV